MSSGTNESVIFFFTGAVGEDPTKESAVSHYKTAYLMRMIKHLNVTEIYLDSRMLY